MQNMKITDVVFDFDGTCTQIPVIYKKYLDKYLDILNEKLFSGNRATPEKWEQAQQKIRDNSPKAGWTIFTTPAAPAAADPYIMAFESAKELSKMQTNTVMDPPREAHSTANEANPAPWRKEARQVFELLLKNNITIHFISNSSSGMIRQRLTDMMGVYPLPSGIDIKSDANKFRISELAIDSKLNSNLKKRFEELPPTSGSVDGRPVYLRRSMYFEAICNALTDLDRLPTTVFCGDIWEMDLAMPAALGANIHLIEREAPFETYQYEYDAVKQLGNKGKISADLNGLLEWFHF